jgi:nucleobase:cation symporter-1, NCS1 family
MKIITDGPGFERTTEGSAGETSPSLAALNASPSLINEDLAPVPPARRTWKLWNFAALWISMAACIPTYMLASSLIGGGMNWSQAIFTIFLANVIVLIPMC